MLTDSKLPEDKYVPTVSVYMLYCYTWKQIHKFNGIKNDHLVLLPD